MKPCSRGKGIEKLRHSAGGQMSRTDAWGKNSRVSLLPPSDARRPTGINLGCDLHAPGTLSLTLQLIDTKPGLLADREAPERLPRGCRSPPCSGATKLFR